MENVITRFRESLGRIGGGASVPIRAALSSDAPAADVVRTPTADVFESGTELLLVIDLPGSRRDAIEVALDGETLAVRAPIADPIDDHGIWQRSFALPFGVDGGRAKASWKDGVLRVQLPKIKLAIDALPAVAEA